MRKYVTGLLLLLASVALAQDPVGIGRVFPSFTLKNSAGQTVNLEDYRGKNVLIVFPRGKVGDRWCQICHYQYLDLADVEERLHLKAKHDLEVLFVLPYAVDEVKTWISIFPQQMKVIQGWKYPTNPDQVSPGRKAFAEKVQKALPKEFNLDAGTVPQPFPVLADEDQVLSKQLDLYRLKWDNSYVEQNQSTMFLLDKTGVVQFKYHSQTTWDRPDADYLVKVLESLL